ncbi:MAG: FAD-binding oxidoreductase [Proteobacteria bacterium]|nr:FAD-binding oxidoreductase [Pseudomonadota bacterium]
MEKSIIIIGGGVIGLTCAYRLAQKNIKVQVFDAETCGGRATTASLGVLMPYVPTIQKPIAILQRTSLGMYEDFAKELMDFSGVDIEFAKEGHLQVLHSEKQFDKAKKTVERSDIDGQTVNDKPAFELLTSEQAKELEPNLPEAKFGCMLSRGTAFLSTEKLVEALKLACLKLNVEIIENTEINDIMIEDGIVKGVISHKDKFFAENVLITTGAYSHKFKEVIPNLAEIQAQKGEAIELKLKERKFTKLIKLAGMYALCKADGTTFIGSTSSRKPDFSEDFTEKGLRTLIKGGKRIIPDISEKDIVRKWTGHRPHSYLGSPLLGEADEAKGLFVATGHGKIGICTAPFTAKIMAALIIEQKEIIDLTPFRVNKQKQKGSKD